MKQVKLLCIGLGMLSFMLLVNCGEAGVQIKVGGDYESEFNATSTPSDPLATALTFNKTAFTTVNSEVRDYGSNITELEVKSLSVTVENFRETLSDPITGNIIVDINENTFSSGSVTISNNTVIPLNPDSSNGLVNLSNTLRSGDVSIGLTINGDTPFGDDSFDAILSILAFATVQVD